jgi:FkbM family methyltransferase
LRRSARRTSDVALLLDLRHRLADRAVIDVGARRGAFVEACLEGDDALVYAVEADPSNAAHLRKRFARDARVQVLEAALGRRDETRDLSVGEDLVDDERAIYRSLVAASRQSVAQRSAQVRVTCRSLASLVEDGTLPRDVGLLKIDAAGYELEIVQGMGRLSPAVVTVAYGGPLPPLSAPAHSLQEVGDAMAGRGYAHSLVERYQEGFRVLQLDSFAIRQGESASAIFVHDRAYPQVERLLRDAVQAAQNSLLDTARYLRRQADLLPTRLDRWLKPRLGHLRHYPPRPLTIHSRYRTQAPVAGGPRVSIVTAALNAGQFLERTLRSVIEQQYEPLEYVVQDGGSTDGSADILDRYRDRLAAVHVERDSGQADALNRGFARTTGEIMAYLNGDDVLLPGALRYVGRYFSAHPDVDVVYGHRVLIDEHDAEVGRWVLPRHSSSVLSWADYVPQETLFWRRGVWERAGGRLDDSFHFAMDWELLLRFRANGARFVRLPRFLGAFRVHDDQKTSARIADLGAREMAELRERQHGRRVAGAEVRRRIRGYLLRHMLYQKLYRLGILDY